MDGLEDLQSAADITTFSTTTHGDWLSGHLLSLALQICVSYTSRDCYADERLSVRVVRQRRGRHPEMASPSAGTEAVGLPEQAY